jgi:hypothetical protein
VIFVPRTRTGIPVEGPCRNCGRTVRVDANNCPHCGIPGPVAPAAGATGFEWKTDAELFGYPLVHVAFGRDARGRRRVARGVIAVGQFAVGAFTVAQFGAAFVLGLGQFIIAPVAIGQVAVGFLFGLGQLATGYAAIGQLAIGSYAVGQVGFAFHFWGPGHEDPRALEFFRGWGEKLGIDIFG